MLSAGFAGLVLSATACLTVDTRAASVYGAACRAVRPLVPGSYLFGVGLPEEHIYAVFLGEDFRARRIQHLLVRQWIHVTASLRHVDLFPYTAQCLVLSGTCYASVTKCSKFHVFTWNSTSDPEVDSRGNCGFSAVAGHQGRRHFLRVAEAHPHGPCDHRDSPVAPG